VSRSDQACLERFDVLGDRGPPCLARSHSAGSRRPRQGGQHPVESAGPPPFDLPGRTMDRRARPS
jgi:hypothetical protein